MSLRAKRGNLVAILSDIQGCYALATRLPRRPACFLPVLLLAMTFFVSG